MPSRVLLPDPDLPMMAEKLPAGTEKAHAAQNLQGAVEFFDPFDLDGLVSLMVVLSLAVQ